MNESWTWFGGFAAKVRALFQGEAAVVGRPLPSHTAVAVDTIVAAPSVKAPDVLAPVAEVTRARPVANRLLAARLASQAKLNVPTGKTPRMARIQPAKAATSRPTKTEIVKIKTQVRGGFVVARRAATLAQIAQSRAVLAVAPVKNNVIALHAAPRAAKSVSKSATLKARIAA